MGLICFDLDGTLVDPLRAMDHCIQMTCKEMGIQSPPREDIGRHVGFGPWALFGSLPGLQDPGKLAEAVGRYWTHFEDSGISRHRVYEGVPLMLTRLRRQGHSLFVVTVKPVRYARRVLHEFDLLLSFDEVFGTAPKDRHTSKNEVVTNLRLQGIVKPGGYIVGDRADDMASGKGNGLIPLGVTYGFGSATELQDAGADKLFGSPAALDDWFKTSLPGSEIHDAFSKSE
jgi:phosphoglycolate phosphatase